VISVIVYGRNDAHGYNLHRRAALSLNCIAEVLTDPDDEIVFVDYNTPDELPTFVEALADTLTDRCLELLRVFRVPAAIHGQRFAARTHLPAIEPVARNAGVRRANPANRWLLSTNTDMIFLPRAAGSLSEICAELPDGFYGLPRFELPEWLWERLPRSDPRKAMAELERLGSALRLDEPTISHEWIRFDAPGDFQLILREDYVAIDGLDEQMLLGYHVDSNLSRRMLFHRGSIESLGDRLAGYHCNHNREPTVYHGGKVMNDLDRFVVTIDQPKLPAQQATWGLFDVALEEVSVRERSGPTVVAALAAAIQDSGEPPKPSDAAQVPFELTYDTGHVLPFVADSLAVSSSDTTIGYLGANPVLERMLSEAVEGLGFHSPLEVAKLDDLAAVEKLARAADVLVVDLGLDASLVDASLSAAGDHQPAHFPGWLAQAFDALERLIELERARLELGEHPRRFVLVHSWTVFWDAYVVAHLDCSHTTAHSRVRRAIVRPVPLDDEETREALARERRIIRWAGRAGPERERLLVRPYENLELADLRDYGGFGGGWAYPDERGIWTQDSRSELALALDGDAEDNYVLAFSIDSVCVEPDASLRVEALVNGEPAAVREFRYGDPEWHIELPARARSDGKVNISLEVEAPRTPLELGWSSDERRIGILLSGLSVLPAEDEAARAGLARERRLLRWAARGSAGERRLHVGGGETVDLDELDDYGGFGDGWLVYPREAGIWTEGSRSELALALDGIGDSDYALELTVGSVCVSEDASLPIEAFVNGTRAAAREITHGDPEWRIELPSPTPADGRVDLAFVAEDPKSPLELGWSDDDRRLGILLRELTLEEIDRSVWAGDKVIFGEGSGAQRLLGEGWSTLEQTGVWSVGEEAFLVLRPRDLSPATAELVLAVSAFVTPDNPELGVDISALDEHLGGRVFRDGEGQRLLRVPFPEAAASASRTVFSLRISDPARPVDLGLADDARRLGLHLEWLMVRKRTAHAPFLDAVREKSTNLRSRLKR
jgi:hypothetical protein